MKSLILRTTGLHLQKKLKIDQGKLKDLDVTIIKVFRFQGIEDKVNDLFEAHKKLIFRTKCGLSWIYP